MKETYKAFVLFLASVAVFSGISAFKTLPYLPGEPQMLYYKLSSSNISELNAVNSDAYTGTMFGVKTAPIIKTFGLKGESTFIAKTQSNYDFKVNELKTILSDLNAQLKAKEQGEFFNSEYYYSPKISVYSTINGTKVNIHVAYGSNGIRVGCPMIFSSY